MHESMNRSQVRVKMVKLNSPMDISLVLYLHSDVLVSEVVAVMADLLGEPEAHVILFPVNM